DDLAEELVAEHVARLHCRDVAAEEMQVRAAHRARPHLQDDVLAVAYPRLGDLLDLDVVRALPAQRLHSRPSPWATRSATATSRPPGPGWVVPGASGSTTSPTSRMALACRSAVRSFCSGSLPCSFAIGPRSPIRDGSRSRAASSAPLSPGAGRT